MSPFREIAGFNAPQLESPTRISRAKAALKGPVTDNGTDARPSRDGSEQFGSGTPARKHTSMRPNLSRPRVELGPNRMTRAVNSAFPVPKTRFDI